MIDVAIARAYLRVPATALSDEDLARMLAAQQADQNARCTWAGADAEPPQPAPDALDQALLRRLQREVAARNLPLGMVGLDSNEYGPERLPFYDALVEEHERAFRRVVLA